MKELRKLNFNRMVVGLTGDGMEDAIQRFLESGVDIVFVKPIRIETLKAFLNYVKKYGNHSDPNKKLKVSAGRIMRYLLHE